MLQLNDILKLAGVNLQDFKIHCATSKVNPPLDVFFDGKFKEWQEAGGNPHRVARIMQDFEPMLNQGRYQEAEALLDRAIEFFENK